MHVYTLVTRNKRFGSVQRDYGIFATLEEAQEYAQELARRTGRGNVQLTWTEEASADGEVKMWKADAEERYFHIDRRHVTHRPAVRWYAKRTGDLADVMFEHLVGAHAGKHEQYMRLPWRAAGVFVQLMNALEQHGVAYVQCNDEALSELVAKLAGELYSGAFV